MNKSEADGCLGNDFDEEMSQGDKFKSMPFLMRLKLFFFFFQ